jgi:hypothetical protein
MLIPFPAAVQFDWLVYPNMGSLAACLEGGHPFANGTLARKLLPILLEIDIRRLGARLHGAQATFWRAGERAGVEACAALIPCWRRPT